MKYAFRGAWHFKTIDPTVAANELAALHETIGEPTAADVVEAARPDDAPLHPAFEWDDTAAAEEWRLYQARQLIRAMVIIPDEPEAQPIRAFLNISAPAENRARHFYVPVHRATPEQRSEVVDRWSSTIATLEARLRAFVDFTPEVEGAFAIIREAIAEKVQS